MASIARLIGGAGTGKTTELLRVMGAAIEAGGLEPDRVGFVSFTRAARAEAAGRAAERFGVRPGVLEQDGWFRTLHSFCYRILKVGRELLVPGSESHKWITEALQEEASLDASQDHDLLAEADASSVASDATTALRLWQAARNRLVGLRDVYEQAAACVDKIPELDYCRRIVDRYEQFKLMDHRCDFTDLLGRFAGWRFRLDGPERCTPEGDVPALPVYFFDEQQDTSRLLDSVCRRLIDHPACRWVYVVGDPFQSIYQFAGAEPQLFLGWKVDKERVMPKSYRCPQSILQLGEAVLRECSDYFDRAIAPADHDGEVEVLPLVGDAIKQVDPRDSWLFIARTNFQAKRIAGTLDKLGIPWAPTRGLGGWNAPVRNTGLLALLRLQQGHPIEPSEWRQALKALPQKAGGVALLTRGTKTQWESKSFTPAEPLAKLGDLERWGATEGLRSMIGGGQWADTVDHGREFVEAEQRWGWQVAMEPRVRVGTIHSVKGSEADNVALLTTTSAPVSRSAETPGGADEERRVAYVGITRARRRLIIVNERNRQARMEIPA